MRKVTGVDCTWDVTSDEPGPARVPWGGHEAAPRPALAPRPPDSTHAGVS